MKIEHISASREQCFTECQAKYRFRYHLETPSPVPEPVYFTFGKIVHKACEEYCLCKGGKSIHDIAKDIISGKLELQPGQKSPQLDIEHKNKLTKHLKNFLRLTEKIGLEGKTEWKFNMKLDNEGRCITGFIDRIIQKDDSFFVFDYKTTKPSMWRTNEKTITQNLQLMYYAYVVMKEFNADPKKIKLALVFLDDYKIFPVCFSKKTLLSVPDRLLKIYKEIENLHPDKVWGNVGNHCRFCDYRSVCSFYSLT